MVRKVIKTGYIHGADRKMYVAVLEEVLSDGSKIYDVGLCGKILYQAPSKERALVVFSNLEDVLER